jgi:myo-inositol-1(or 4)-monophosphatase
MFTAEKGRGAFLNDRRRLRVAGRKSLSDALLTTGIPHRGRSNHPRFLREAEHLMKEVTGLRRTGSAALDLAYVAAGRFDGYWEYGLGAWDLAGGVVILKEAGGVASDLEGKEDFANGGDIVAGNKAIHEQLRSALKSVAKP